MRNRILRIINRIWPRYVYVLVANEQERVRECLVFASLDEAMGYRDKLIAIWGGANVCMASREIGSVPLLLQRFEQAEKPDEK